MVADGMIGRGFKNRKALADGRRIRRALFRWPIREEVDRSKPDRRWEEESFGPKNGATCSPPLLFFR
jgi:hypothetical protein